MFAHFSYNVSGVVLLGPTMDKALFYSACLGLLTAVLSRSEFFWVIPVYSIILRLVPGLSGSFTDGNFLECFYLQSY